MCSRARETLKPDAKGLETNQFLVVAPVVEKRITGIAVKPADALLGWNAPREA
jgi:hypothetical protein